MSKCSVHAGRGRPPKDCPDCVPMDKEEKFAYMKGYLRQYRIDNREIINARKRAENVEHPDRKIRNHRKRMYGVTDDDLTGMLTEQIGLCPICSANIQDSFHVDHDHKTGRVRALLCRACNVGLGHFRDDPSALRMAANYLEKWSLPPGPSERSGESSING